MNAGATSERVYDALKRQLLSGKIAPGDRIEPAIFADMLASSVTPVRDALHRLTGEQIVEMRPADGFHLPLVTEPGLRDLLAWNAALLALALRRSPGHALSEPPDIDLHDYAGGLRAISIAIANRSENLEVRHQVEAANDRLEAARSIEGRMLPDPASELVTLSSALQDGDGRTIGRRLARHHRQSLQLVPRVVRTMYEPR